jgi:UDP-N-acetylenolpyruvoylglucosamine reductase
VGGPADLYVEPASEADLTEVLRYCAERQMPWFLLGRGSNLLVRDGGFRGTVICLSQAAFSSIEVQQNKMRCGAGAKLKAVAVEARRQGLGGLEFLEGIPGSVGGALRMNAGAMGGETFGVVETVRLMEPTGEIRDVAARELTVAYRGCASLKNRIALAAVLVGQPTARELIEQRMSEFSQKRWHSQPAAPSAGCMFKNPTGHSAGKLIDELGLKGTRVGGAVVSQEHGNFLVNDGGATARDVLNLIELVRARVREQRGVELETEVQLIGTD